MEIEITANHFFYIPAMLTIGGIIGFFLGKRHTERLTAEHAAQTREQGGASARARRRAERRAEDGEE